MAISNFLQSLSTDTKPESTTGATGASTRKTRSVSKLWMLLDAITVLGAAVIATLAEANTGPIDGDTVGTAVRVHRGACTYEPPTTSLFPDTTQWLLA